MSSMSSTSRHAALQTTATQTYQEPKPRSQDSLTELPSDYSPDIICDRVLGFHRETAELPGAQAKGGGGGAKNQNTWKGEGGDQSRNSYRKIRFSLARQERSKEGDSDNKEIRAHHCGG
ncbi:MAG: hypothetical protein Q9177_002044 [Variospora cf. flavescens]